MTQAQFDLACSRVLSEFVQRKIDEARTVQPRAVQGILEVIHGAVATEGGASAMSFRVCADGTAEVTGWDSSGVCRETTRFVRGVTGWTVQQ